MFKPITVEALPKFRLRVAYADGVEGVVDLSHLALRGGIFSAWTDPKVFAQVYVDPKSAAIAWSPEIELCPDAIYLELTGQSAESAFSKPESTSYARAV